MTSRPVTVTVTVIVDDGDVTAAREALNALEAEAFCTAHATPEQLAANRRPPAGDQPMTDQQPYTADERRDDLNSLLACLTAAERYVEAVRYEIDKHDGERVFTDLHRVAEKARSGARSLERVARDAAVITNRQSGNWWLGGTPTDEVRRTPMTATPDRTARVDVQAAIDAAKANNEAPARIAEIEQLLAEYADIPAAGTDYDWSYLNFVLARTLVDRLKIMAELVWQHADHNMCENSDYDYERPDSCKCGLYDYYANPEVRDLMDHFDQVWSAPPDEPPNP